MRGICLVSLLFVSYSFPFVSGLRKSLDYEHVRLTNGRYNNLKLPNNHATPSSLYSSSSQVVASKEMEKPGKKLETFGYFFLWYFISIFYNIHNKKALTLLKAPWFVATSQMGLGLPIFIPLWLTRLREFPANDASEFFDILKTLNIVAIYQTLTHIAGVIALGAGAVSFTQVVKASEPAFTAFISAVFERQFFPIPVYLTLIPVMAGVSLASLTELSFSWYCLFAGVMSNIFGAARGVFGKKQMCGDTRCIEQISPENYYAVLTLISFFWLLPVTLAVEWRKIISFNLADTNILLGLRSTLISGILFYLYNEVSFKALNNVHPVTHALANTLKRIVIIISSVIVFKNTIQPLGIVGSCLAIGGVCAYSLAQHYTKKPKQKKEEVVTVKTEPTVNK